MALYHRIESPTQTVAVALLQFAAGEIWGKAPRGGMCPTVQAYYGGIGARRGIQFNTEIDPQPYSSPFEARWYLGITPGVLERVDGLGDEHACVMAVVENHQP